MGRGDKKSKKGKIFRGSYGVVRPRNTDKAITVEAITTVTKKKAEAEKKTVTQKKKKVKK